MKVVTAQDFTAEGQLDILTSARVGLISSSGEKGRRAYNQLIRMPTIWLGVESEKKNFTTHKKGGNLPQL